MFKFLVILLLLGVVASLFSGLFFMFRDGPRDNPAADPGRNRRAARALTVRVALSLVLFSVLILGYHWGWYTPGAR